MRIGIPILLMAAILTVNGAAIAANPGNAVVGLWLTQGNKARVEIVQERGVYDGHIVWLKEPIYPANDPNGMGGEPKVDLNNPNTALRDRPIVTLPLVSGFHYAGKDVWEGGSIYDPESGKTYKCKMVLMPDGSLHVRGYVGISLFGRTTIWHRFVPGKQASSPPAARTH